MIVGCVLKVDRRKLFVRTEDAGRTLILLPLPSNQIQLLWLLLLRRLRALGFLLHLYEVLVVFLHHLLVVHFLVWDILLHILIIIEVHIVLIRTARFLFVTLGDR